MRATLIIDPSCPWGYSALPDIAVLRWRYRDALDWEISVIGAVEDPDEFERHGYTPLSTAQSYAGLRGRFGMPFDVEPRSRMFVSERACRAVVAVRLRSPQHTWAALRALQFAWFCSHLPLDQDLALVDALTSVAGLDAGAIVAALDAPDVDAAYADDRAIARDAVGSPTHAQGKTSSGNGVPRYPSPTLRFRTLLGKQLEAGGFQSVAVYDALLANLDPALSRAPRPTDALEVIEAFDHGLTTQEIAAVLAPPLTDPDRDATEARMLELVAGGRVRRVALGNDALWQTIPVPVRRGVRTSAGSARPRRAAGAAPRRRATR